MRAPPPSRVSIVALVSPQTPSSSRVVELDALRGLAALAVVAFHYTTHYGNEVGHIGSMPVSFDFGNYGVELFFLISGFVIFMTLERTRTAMDFVVSRFSRLFPAYWTAILLSSVVVYTIGMPSQRLPWKDVAFDFTMIQEILGAEHLDGSYWTLQVELFFYLQMLFWFMLGQLGRIRWIMGGWLVLAVVFGLAKKLDMHVSYTVGELLIVRYIPFFAIGILFHLLRTQPGFWKLDSALIGLSLIAIGLAYKPVLLVVGLVCTAIFVLFHLGWLRALRWAPFTFLGAISYSLYLLHQAIGFSVIWQMEKHGIAPAAAALMAAAMVTVLATGLTWWVERPAMQAIRRWWKRHHAPVPA